MPSERRFMDLLKAYAFTTRLEYLPGEIPAAFVVLFLGTTTFSEMLSLRIVEGLVVFLLLFTTGFAINALADIDIDRSYGTFKSDLPQAVERVGKKGMWTMIILETVAAVVLSLHITLLMGSYIPLVLTLLGVFFGYGYSVWPIRFKERGVLHAISLSASAFFLPALFLMFIIQGSLTLTLFIFFLGFALLHYGMEFGNQAIDFVEDEDNGVKTPPVRWGLYPSLVVGLVLMVAGFALEVLMVPSLVASKLAGQTSLAMGSEVVVLILACLLMVGYILPFYRMAQMVSFSKTEKDRSEITRGLRMLCKYSHWQVSGILGVAFASALLFFIPLAFPMSLTINEVDPGVVLESASITDVAFMRTGDNVSSRLTFDVVVSGEVQPGDLELVFVSLFAGDILDQRTVVLNTSLSTGQRWMGHVDLECHREGDTTFTYNIYRIMDGGGEDEGETEEVLWQGIMHSDKPVYVSTLSYEIVQVSSGVGGLKDTHANVTVSIFVEQGVVYPGYLTLTVESFNSLGSKFDEASTSLNTRLDEGDVWTDTILLDISDLDVDGANFKVELFDDVASSLVDEAVFY